MKTTNLAIWSLVALLAAGFAACKKDDMKITGPHMTLTTTKNPGENICLCIVCYDEEDKAGVWIDLNNNGIEDGGEADIKFDFYKEYPLGAQTITIYGKVEELHCDNNRLKSLDVSKNSALEVLDCQYNQITALDVSKNTELLYLICKNNQLTSLNVSKNTELRYLHCNNNQLISLNVSNNIKLEELRCHVNQLTTLNVSNNTNLQYLYCYNNSIFGTNMTALVNSLPARTVGDEGFIVVINLDGDGNVCTVTQVNIAKGKNWYAIDSDLNYYAGS